MVASAPGGPMAQEIAALCFDACGTVFDVHSVARPADTYFPGKGEQLSAVWRARQLEYRWLRTLMGRSEDSNRVTLSALEWSMESLGLEDGGEAQRALLDESRKLAVFPEVPAALEKLAQMKPLAILSNGHPDMLNGVVDHNGLPPLFPRGILSVHPARRFQPDASVYRIAEEQLGVTRPTIGL